MASLSSISVNCAGGLAPLPLSIYRNKVPLPPAAPKVRVCTINVTRAVTHVGTRTGYALAISARSRLCVAVAWAAPCETLVGGPERDRPMYPCDCTWHVCIMIVYSLCDNFFFLNTIASVRLPRISSGEWQSLLINHGAFVALHHYAGATAHHQM